MNKSVEQTKMWMECVRVSVPFNERENAVNVFLNLLGLIIPEQAEDLHSSTFQSAFGEVMRKYER